MTARDLILSSIRRSLGVTGAEAPRRKAVEDRLSRAGVPTATREEALGTLERAGLVDDARVAAGRAAALDNYPDGVRWPLRRMRHVRRNEERPALMDNVINDAIALADPHFDVAFELVEILFGIHQMKIVPRIRAFDDHHKKIPAIVKIAVAHRWFKFIGVLFDPVL